MFSVPNSLEGVNERGTNVSLRVDERVFPDMVEQKLGALMQLSTGLLRELFPVIAHNKLMVV